MEMALWYEARVVFETSDWSTPAPGALAQLVVVSGELLLISLYVEPSASYVPGALPFVAHARAFPLGLGEQPPHELAGAMSPPLCARKTHGRPATAFNAGA
jgi:hypothetical protein